MIDPYEEAKKRTTPPVTAPVHPGGWVDGIGWVSDILQLNDDDLAAPNVGGGLHRSGGIAVADLRLERWPLVIVTRWADGTTPQAPTPNRDHTRAAEAEAIAKATYALGDHLNEWGAASLDLVESYIGAVCEAMDQFPPPQAPTGDSVPVPRAEWEDLRRVVEHFMRPPVATHASEAHITSAAVLLVAAAAGVSGDR